MEQKQITENSYINYFFEMIHYIAFRFAKLMVNHPKFTLYGIAATMIIAVVCIFAIKPTAGLNAHPDHVNNKYFTSIQVECGDTLWEIAQEYITPEYASIQEYVDEVIAINHISENDITAGCYLVVPYYAETPEYK